MCGQVLNGILKLDARKVTLLGFFSALDMVGGAAEGAAGRRVR